MPEISGQKYGIPNLPTCTIFEWKWNTNFQFANKFGTKISFNLEHQKLFNFNIILLEKNKIDTCHFFKNHIYRRVNVLYQNLAFPTHLIFLIFDDHISNFWNMVEICFSFIGCFLQEKTNQKYFRKFFKKFQVSSDSKICEYVMTFKCWNFVNKFSRRYMHCMKGFCTPLSKKYLVWFWATII